MKGNLKGLFKILQTVNSDGHCISCVVSQYNSFLTFSDLLDDNVLPMLMFLIKALQWLGKIINL
mgnify:CR=1 FL=1